MRNGEILFKNAIVKLLSTEPFWSSISYYVKKVSTDKIPTMTVTFHDKKYILLYNCDFVEGLYDKYPDDYREKIISVIKHEYLHLLFDHVEVMLNNKSKSKELNIAMDLAINSFLVNELPEGGMIPGQGPFEDMPLFKNYLWYYERVIKNIDDAKKDLLSTIDDHLSESDVKEILGGDYDGGDQELIDNQGATESSNDKEKVDNEFYREYVKKKMLENAVDVSIQSNTWGNISKRLQDEIIARLKGKVDWKSYMKYFVNGVVSSDNYSTFRRINKRYPWQAPGVKRERYAKIAVSIDMSGSMSNEMLSDIATELNSLAEFVEFTVIPFDTSVEDDKIYKWKKGQKMNTIKRVLSGGTDLDSPIEYVDNSSDRFSGHIMFSDLYASKPKRTRTKMMMIVPEGGDTDFEYEFAKIINL